MTFVKKIKEFQAHTGSVNCLKIGHGNSSLLGTGGEDRKVNIWEVGQMKVLVSLGGHQSAVESIAFDADNKNVAAGAVGGTVKLWDIDQARVNRSFAGHRSGVISVCFHPIKGDFVASGSADTNVKVWDLKKKTCLQAYKGHAKGVCCLAFSPDGKWIASGSEDGEVKLWDLRTGKLLHNFGDHMARITGIEYHPKECMLATSSADRTMRLWDLDTFHSIEVLGPETSPIRSIAFTPEGDSLIAAVSEGIRQWKWEPSRKEESISVPWSHVVDIAIDSQRERIIGCSVNGAMVGVHSIDLSSTLPAIDETRDVRTISRSRSHPFSVARRVQSPKPVIQNDLPGRLGSIAGPTASMLSPYTNLCESENINPLEYESDILSRLGEDEEPHEFPPVAFKGSDPPRPASALDRHLRATSPLPTARTTPRSTPRNNNPRQRFWSAQQGTDSCWLGRSDDPIYSARSVNTKASWQGHVFPNPSGELTTRSTVPRSSRSVSSLYRKESDHVLTRTWTDSIANIRPPRHGPRMDPLETQRVAVVDEETALSEILEKRDMMSNILSARLSGLQIVRAFWARGDVRGALRALQRCNDPSVTSDVLEAVRSKPNVFDLDAIPDVAPSLKCLLESDHDKYWLTAMATVTTLLQSFSDIIHEVTANPGTTLGVDLSFEQRRSKCLAAKSALEDLCPLLELLTEQKGIVGQQAEELHLQLAEL